jgi:MFS family permease
MLLGSISAVVTFFLEVPSGVIADRYSRKKILMIGNLITTMGLIVIFFSDNYQMIVIAAVLMGVSEALESGADTAFIYDFFKNKNMEHRYKSYISSIYHLGFICSAMAAFVSGSVFKYNNDLPIIITIVLSIASFIAITFAESDEVKYKAKFELRGILKQEVSQIKDIFSKRDLMKIIFVYIVMTIVISNLNYLAQIYLKENSIDLKFFGLIFLAFNILASIGAKNSSRFSNIKPTRVLGAYAIILIFLSMDFGIAGVGLIFAARFINGFIWPVLDVTINENIDSQNRATILSYKSLMVQISFIFVDPLIGVLVDLKNVHFTYFVMGIVIFVVLVFRFINAYHVKKL